MHIKRWVLALVVLLYGELSFADCTFNGVNYPDGTVLGPYVCSGTQWVVRR
jgi:hypothetical protein